MSDPRGPEGIAAKHSSEQFRNAPLVGERKEAPLKKSKQSLTETSEFRDLVQRALGLDRHAVFKSEKVPHNA